MNFKIALFFPGFLFFSLSSFGQEDGYVPYNKHHIGSFLEERNENVFSSMVSADLDYEYSIPGNLRTWLNSGMGIGYNYRVLMDDFAQSVSIDAKAEWYPGAFYKFHTILEADLIGMGTPPNECVYLLGIRKSDCV